MPDYDYDHMYSIRVYPSPAAELALHRLRLGAETVYNAAVEQARRSWCGPVSSVSLSALLGGPAHDERDIEGEVRWLQQTPLVAHVPPGLVRHAIQRHRDAGRWSQPGVPGDAARACTPLSVGGAGMLLDVTAHGLLVEGVPERIEYDLRSLPTWVQQVITSEPLIQHDGEIDLTTARVLDRVWIEREWVSGEWVWTADLFVRWTEFPSWLLAVLYEDPAELSADRRAVATLMGWTLP